MSWIKIRTNLSADPRVFRIASFAKIPTAHVVGCLVQVWAYADEHSTDGRLPFCVVSDIDRIAGVEGFSDWMLAVGWLDIQGQDIVLPRFDTHNGATAKARAQGARRQVRYRESEDGNASSVTGQCEAVTPRPSLEKRREEKSRGRARRGSKGGGL